MVSKTRIQRINERIREELSELLLLEISDPRIEGASITDVRVDCELTYAEIYFSSLEGSERAAEIQEGLEHAQGFLRHALAERVQLRIFPKLRFHWDPTFERAERIEKLFAEIKAENQKKPEEGLSLEPQSGDEEK